MLFFADFWSFFLAYTYISTNISSLGSHNVDAPTYLWTCKNTVADVDITFYDRDSDADLSHWFTHNKVTGKIDVIVDVAMLNAVDGSNDIWIRLKAKDHNPANPCGCTDERNLLKLKL